MLVQPVPQQQYKFFGRQYSGPEGGSQNLPPVPIVNSFPVQPYSAYKQVNINQQRPNFLVGKGPDLRDGDDSKFDGKRARKTIQRRTVDYSSSVIEQMKGRIWKKSVGRCSPLQPDVLYYAKMTLPRMYLENPVNCVTTRFVRTSTNKIRCPIFCSAWTPEGRRLVTGASSGEFTLWNGLTFNFETILQAHESAVRAMEWSNNDMWLLSGDNSGIIKYWQSNMNNVKMFQAHVDPIRGVSFSPTDNKFATCSDDGLVKIWDFYRCYEEKTLRGHGADVKCVDWHPTKSLLVSGSKDSQQPMKLWDPKSGAGLATIHGHKSTVMDLEWNENGNWLLTASRDHLIKIFDIRMMREIQTFRGHKKEATAVNWHPIHESFFASAGSDGSIFFWMLGCEKDLGSVDNAHDGMIWTIKWHPLGHIVCTGSNDHTSKFWTRNRPGDLMKDRHNLNTSILGAEEDYEYAVPSFIENSASNTSDVKVSEQNSSQFFAPSQSSLDSSAIPGLVVQSIPGLETEAKKNTYESSFAKTFNKSETREMSQASLTSYRHSGFRLPTKEELESGNYADGDLQIRSDILKSIEEIEEPEPIVYEADENDQGLDQEIRNEFLEHIRESKEKDRGAPKNDGKGLLPTPDKDLLLKPPVPTVSASSGVQRPQGNSQEHQFESGDRLSDAGRNKIKPLFDNYEELREKYEWDPTLDDKEHRLRNPDRNHFDGDERTMPRERRNVHPNVGRGWRPEEEKFMGGNNQGPQRGFGDSVGDRFCERGPRFRGGDQRPADDYQAGSKRPFFDNPPKRGFYDNSRNNARGSFQNQFSNEPTFRDMPQMRRDQGFPGGNPHHSRHTHQEGRDSSFPPDERFNNDNPMPDGKQTNFAPNGPKHFRHGFTPSDL